VPSAFAITPAVATVGAVLLGRTTGTVVESVAKIGKVLISNCAVPTGFAKLFILIGLTLELPGHGQIPPLCRGSVYNGLLSLEYLSD
jgi:hypothetical protein